MLSPLMKVTLGFFATFVVLSLIAVTRKSGALVALSMFVLYITVVLFNIWVAIALWHVMGKTNALLKILAIVVAETILAIPEFYGIMFTALFQTASLIRQ